MALSDKKTVYHSALVAAGDVDVLIKSNEPQKSKFGDQPDYIAMVHEGKEHFYPVENRNCAEALTGLGGQTVTIRAEGSREEATIAVFGAPNSHRQPDRQPDPQPPHREPNRSLPQRPLPQQSQQPQPREPDPAPQPHRRTKEEKAHDELEAFKDMLRFVRRGGLVLQECINVASEISADKLSTEDRRQLAITLFIEVKGRIDLKQLPVTRPVAAPAQPARQPAPPPRQPEPPAPRTPEDDAEDDIPF